MTKVLNKSHFSLQMGNWPIPVAEHSGPCVMWREILLKMNDQKNLHSRKVLSVLKICVLILFINSSLVKTNGILENPKVKVLLRHSAQSIPSWLHFFSRQLLTFFSQNHSKLYFFICHLKDLKTGYSFCKDKWRGCP